MIQKLKKLLIITAGSAMLLTPAMVPAVASAQVDIQSNLCQGTTGQISTNASAGSCTTNTAEATNKVNSILSTIINVLSLIVGAVAVIMIVIGGLRYITSGGNDSSVASAKNTIIYAIIGLVIVALAQVIVHFVLSKVTGP